MSNIFSLTTFSSDGSLNQENYAITTANNGEISLAIKTKDGVIFACEKNLNSIFIDEISFTKILNLSKFMGCTYSGLGPDFEVLVKKSRKEFQEYNLKFMDDYMPVHSLSREIPNVMQEYTKFWE